MYGSYLNIETITKDHFLKAKLSINMTISNEGTAEIIINNGQKIAAGRTYRVENGNFPLLDETIHIQFVGTGTKLAKVSYGKIAKIPCELL